MPAPSPACQASEPAGVVAVPQFLVLEAHSVCLAVDQPYSAWRALLLLTSSVVPPTAVSNGLLGG